MARWLGPLASLRLTIALLAAAMALIFAGTLAQTVHGVWWVVETYFRTPLAWIDLQLFLPRRWLQTDAAIPFAGGLLIAGLMVVNLLAAHAVRFRLTRRRAGVLVLHAGLIVLLAGEFVTALTAREGLMQIDEGSSSNYTEDIRETELAIIDTGSPESDAVTVVPQRMLERAAQAGPITDPRLPFEVHVIRWLPNAAITIGATDAPSTQGVAQRLKAAPQPRARGVDGSDVDAPAALVSLRKHGADLGTWLVSTSLPRTQRVSAGADSYELSLRYRREYRPYTLHLLDFRHDTFTGTEIARNFSSRVRIVDRGAGVDREAVISMNEPLRYAGEAFYQASFKPDDSGTVLQVVRNPGWLLPYLSCALVALGLAVHFMTRLAEFLRRGLARNRDGANPDPPPPKAGRWIAPSVATVTLVLVCLPLLRRSDAGEYDLDAFAKLPVSAGGRVKPVDTVARAALLGAGGRQTVRTEHGDLGATEFLLKLITRPTEVKDLPVVRIDHPDLLALIGRPGSAPVRVSLAEVEPHWGTIADQAAGASGLPPKQRDPYQRAVVKLHAGVSGLLAVAAMRTPYWLPPAGGGAEWRQFVAALIADRRDQTSDPGVAAVTAMMTASNDGDSAAFNAALHRHADQIHAQVPSATRRAALEVQFNRAQPFLAGVYVYGAAVAALLASMLLRARNHSSGPAAKLRSAALGVITAGLILHTVALALRMYLQGRPPVTNLYSSAVFVGWAGVGLGLWLERLFPVGLAALCAAASGFATLIIAHNLSMDGDTMQVMQAVLDTNFWLATHVVTITLGYSATLFAGLLGAIHILQHRFARRFDDARQRSLASMTYGVVCFAMFLSFVGTVLGGIWADQSWGRFWGWDPKENGAALLVLMNAITLHARWAGIVRPLGVAALAVAGNIVTAWSWFGTNMLGVGLHSYGFMDSAAAWFMAFIALNLAIIALASWPRRPDVASVR